MKRLLDLLAATGGVVILSPLMAAVAAAVARDGGPVFFRQLRVGRGGQLFRMWKFRTMVVDAESRGSSLTTANDPRITPTGAWLRRYRLDELPQLFNVIAGDMSLVGPRPEVPRYVALYNDEQQRVLQLIPGITDPASIAFRDEGELLAGAVDPERFYVERVMPEKIRLNLEYAAGATVLTDLGVVLRTVLALASDVGRGSRAT